MRVSAGMTKTKLADEIGASMTNVGRLERGFSLPTMTTIDRIAGACGYWWSICFEKRRRKR